MSRGNVGWNSGTEGAMQKNVVSMCSEACLAEYHDTNVQNDTPQGWIEKTCEL